jgi:hypothetical protein
MRVRFALASGRVRPDYPALRSGLRTWSTPSRPAIAYVSLVEVRRSGDARVLKMLAIATAAGPRSRRQSPDSASISIGSGFREFVLNQGARPIGAYNVQNVNGFLAHVLTRRHLRDWYPIDAGARFSVLSAGLTAVLVAAAVLSCWRAGRPPQHDASNFGWSSASPS